MVRVRYKYDGFIHQRLRQSTGMTSRILTWFLATGGPISPSDTAQKSYVWSCLGRRSRPERKLYVKCLRPAIKGGRRNKKGTRYCFSGQYKKAPKHTVLVCCCFFIVDPAVAVVDGCACLRNYNRWIDKVTYMQAAINREACGRR